MLHKIYVLNSNFKKYFKNYDFHNLYKELLNFCTVDLSAFYFDIRKDCLYCDTKNSHKRQSTVSILNIILGALLKWFAPILSFTTEEIYQLIGMRKSIHLENFVEYPSSFKNENLNSKWKELIEIRNICNLSIEEKRAKKIIGSSLDASLLLRLNKKKLELVKNIDFAELCITSRFSINKIEGDKIVVKSKKAVGEKCPNCWKIVTGKCTRPLCNI